MAPRRGRRDPFSKLGTREHGNPWPTPALPGIVASLRAPTHSPTRASRPGTALRSGWAHSVGARRAAPLRAGLTTRSRRGPTAGHQARPGGTGTLSPARAWRPTAGPASPQTLGSTGTALQYASKVSAWRRELNTRRGKAANTPGLRSRQIDVHAQAAVTVACMNGSFKDMGFCARSVCQPREKNLISVSLSGRRGRPWRGRRCHPRRRLNT